MKKLIPLLSFTVLSLISQSSIFGQSFLNGSFETTTGSCNFNLTNIDFNSKMSDCNAFGNASQIDIIRSSCSYGAPQQGSFFIGLAVDVSNTVTDALSLTLSEPLIAGNTYVLNFYNKKSAGYNANLLEVGYSTESTSFGSSIDTAALPTTAWGLVSFSFKPAVNSQYITIRTIKGSYGWNFVDYFTILQPTGINNTLAEEPSIQVFPNPTSDFITIRTDNSTKLIAATIKNMQGKTVLVTDKTNIDLSDFGAGIFIVELNTDKGRIVKRVIKN